MKKFIRQLTIFSLIFIMTFGVGFSSQKGINVQAATTQTTTTNDGKLRKNGVLFTGISDNKYYKRGVFTKYTGWKNWKGNRYYLKKGKAVTGWKYLRDYSGSRTKYKYYFKKNGQLSKDSGFQHKYCGRLLRQNIQQFWLECHICLFFHRREGK